MSHLLIHADARRIPLADRSIHAVITSPPYFGLRDYKVRGQIGLERTPSEYVAELVRAFREVWRVIRDDATLWLNIGDSYAGGGGENYGKGKSVKSQGGQQITNVRNRTPWLQSAAVKPKDLIGIPWMLAFALRDDGWYLRSEIIWHKRNGMPESVEDRPTKAHEQVFLLTKKPRYFYDGFAIQEKAKHAGAKVSLGEKSFGRGQAAGKGVKPSGNGKVSSYDVASHRNRRSVWSLTSENYPGSHFAVMPSKLVVPMVKAGTSEKGCCPTCGAYWKRMTERTGYNGERADASVYTGQAYLHSQSAPRGPRRNFGEPTTKHIGWRPTCAHDAAPVPCRVFDPFAGSGTTLVVAEALGRVGIGCDLSADYLAQARRRIERPHQPLPKQREQAMPLFAHMEDT